MLNPLESTRQLPSKPSLWLSSIETLMLPTRSVFTIQSAPTVM